MASVSRTTIPPVVASQAASWFSLASLAGRITGAYGAWEKLAGVFRRPTQTVESFINVREQFKSIFKEHVSALGQTLSPARQESFMRRGETILQGILTSSLDQVMDHAVQRGDARVQASVLQQATARAAELSQLRLQELQRDVLRARIHDAPSYDTRPQILVRPDQTFVLIRPAPLIENLVLRGGGAKGVVNGAALIEMEDAGLLAGLKKVVGTSVGALTAVGLASGQDARAFAELADNTPMTDLQARPDHFDRRYPAVDLNCRIGFHAGRALELLDEVSASNVSSYLVQNWNTEAFQAKLVRLRQTQGEEAVLRLGELRSQDFKVDRTKQMITFSDLAFLHELDPSRFRQLVLTGWDTTRSEMTYFSAESTPHMPVAAAGRISMAIPVMFKSVTLDPGDGLGVRTFTDGGIGSNMPSEAILDKLEGRDLEEARVRTALMTFDDAGEAYDIMHRQPPGSHAALDWIVSKATGHPDYGQASRDDDRKLSEAGPNAFVVFHGDLGTLSLGASPERVSDAKLQASLKMLEQIEQRLGQAYAAECTTVDECYALLSDSERQLLVQGAPPDPSDYPLSVNDPAYRAQRQLLSMAQQADRPSGWA